MIKLEKHITKLLKKSTKINKETKNMKSKFKIFLKLQQN